MGLAGGSFSISWSWLRSGVVDLNGDSLCVILSFTLIY